MPAEDDTGKKVKSPENDPNSLSAPTKKTKKRKEKKEDKSKEKENLRKGTKGVQDLEEPKVVTVGFSGNEYSGIVQTDVKGARTLEGTSRYTWKSGVVYEGPFVASDIEGRGKFTWPDGSVYEGEIKNGKRHGEGVYLASDGVTKYEGQWVQGKRHGTGRISYDVSGECHYLGSWEDGWKHGEGRQVWPSGNEYEGQWKFGKMAGQATMTWTDGGVHEEYVGSWENNNPQGLGTRTWHAPLPKMEMGREGPTQQMNNRYHGEWNRGARHGDGTFFYANGARYCGSWKKNIKHGHGKYTFDNGSVYSGPFTNDQMKEYTDVSQSLVRGALNIGAEDNPVRRCIDVSDVETIALPPDIDRSEYSNVGSGYDENQEVMREVYNTLLRNLAELKLVYGQYRKILRRDGDDPFVLSMHQVWMFARDFDLLTPVFNLSAFNRCVLAGPRHHQEVAGDEALQDLRPLTPKPAADPHAHKRTSRAGYTLEERFSTNDAGEKNDEALDTFLEEVSELGTEVTGSSWCSTPRSAAMEHEEAGKELPPDSPCRQESPPISPTSDSELPVAHTATSDAHNRGTATLALNRASSCVFQQPSAALSKQFWREEDADDVADIHLPDRVLLFRHFLEFFVRVAGGRYPNEKGLETQVRRLFKEILVPKFGLTGNADTIFAFLVDNDICEVFRSFHTDLWRIFKENAVGEGVYGLPMWIEPEPAELPEEEEEGNRQNLFCVSSKLTQQVGAMAAVESSTPASHRTHRRGYAGQQRRVHVKARLDVTVRVKDVLHLLETASLLLPFMPAEKYPPFATDEMHSAVFPGMSAVNGDRETPDACHASRIGPSPVSQDEVSNFSGRTSNTFSRQNSPMSPRNPAESATQNYSQKASSLLTRASTQVMAEGSSPSASFSRRGGGGGGAKTVPSSCRNSQTGAWDLAPRLAEVGEHLVIPGPVMDFSTPAYEPADLSEVLACDFKVTILEVLKLLSEVSSPHSVENLRWALRGEDLAQEELIGILDFVESELTFVEFQRLLLRIVEEKTQVLDPDIAGRLPSHRRLQGFLDLVLMPALNRHGTAKSKPEAKQIATEGDVSGATEVRPEDREGNKETVVSDDNEDKGDDKEPPAVEPAIEASGPQSPQARLFGLWRGFDDGDLECLEEDVAPRVWPEDFEQSVGSW